tara:strand:- start:845 stop:1138 length:294 start_codon:yes stop_codon:yes gene_type:complete
MLKINKFDKNDIISIKLLAGEEIIAKFISDEENSIIVERATTMAANPQGGLALVPWMMSALPETIELNKATIITMSPTAKEIADKFIEATTNIALAK